VRLQANADGLTHTIEVEESGETGLVRVKVDEREYLIDVTSPSSGTYSLLLDGKLLTAYVSLKRGKREVQLGTWSTSVEVGPSRGRRPFAKPAAGVAGRQEIAAPMSGRVVQVLVRNGQAVQEGASLVIVEAMKMETEIRSPIAGQVKEVQVQPGMAIETGQLLLVVEGVEISALAKENLSG
jgi:biotin carboxyl carrier protein